MMPSAPTPSETALLNAAQSGSLDDAALLAAVRAPRSDSPMQRRLDRVRRFVSWFMPEALREASLDVRRRARFVVLIAFAIGPFYGVLVQQLWVNGLIPQAMIAAGCGTVVLLCPFLLRWTASHVLPGALVCLLTGFIIFFQAYSDAGLFDPILYWSALVPLAAALSVGPRLSLACALLNLTGIGLLYALATSGHTFPHLTPQPELNLAALLSVSTATLFALLWGWLYERHTLRELRLLSDRLGQLHSALVRSEERYRTLFDNVPLGVYRSTPDGRVLMVNPAFVRMLGYDSEEEIQHLFPSGDVYEDADQRRRFQELIESEGEVQQFAAVWKRKDGRRLHVRENARAAFGPDGQLLYYEGTVEDVTAQRRVQQALRKSEERFRSLVQHASDVTAVLDGRSTLTYLSPSVERILGYAPADLLGRPPFALVHPEDRRRARLFSRQALVRRGVLGSAEFRIRHADGHYVYVESVGSNLLHDANVGGLVLNVRDITERKRAEAVLVHAKEQAEEVARLKSAFLANMSHEIRTPLTGILGFADILADEVSDPQQREFVGLIEKSGQRLMDTLNSVLDLARLEAGRMELTLEPIPLAEAAEEAVRLLQPLAQERGLVLESHVRAPGVEARVDPGALDRILTNLVGNAIKFTDTGQVAIEVDADATHALLRVCDTGVGMSEEFLARLFNEFEQESTGIGRSHEGSGLGLSITRQLVEHMGGEIEVESTKGQGSTFTVRFPRTERDTPAAPVETAAAAEPTFGHHLLVVDDNAQTRHLVVRMLRAAYAVREAATMQEALAAAADQHFDAVLMDINLGAQTSGEDVMHHLRALPAYAEVPIIAFTAYALPGDRERFLNSGFSGYLAKPFTKGQLMALLATVLAETPAEAPTLMAPEPPRAPQPSVEEASLKMIIPAQRAEASPLEDEAPAGDGAPAHFTSRKPAD